jgi:hypothetical protein
VRFWNGPAETVFGIPRDEAAGSRERLQHAMTAGCARYEVAFRRCDGAPISADVSGNRVSQDASPAYAVISARDVPRAADAARRGPDPSLRSFHPARLYASGYTDDVVARRGFVKREASFLENPFTPDRLAGKVRGVLDSE